MLASHMRRAQLVELSLYVAIALWLHGRGVAAVSAMLAVPALVLGTRFVLVCTMFALAWIHRMARSPEHRIGLLRGTAMVLREWADFLVLNLYRTPWHGAALRPDPPPEAAGDRPIVLVHGYFANRGCWAPLVASLESAGAGPVFAPSCCSHFASIEQFEEELHAQLERIAHGRRVVLIAHSMGGLVARLYLARRGGARVARLVTIGSPHQGTRLARWGMGANARQMVPGSAFLKDLERREAASDKPPTLAIYSAHDNMILPQDAARLPWARNVCVAGIGHVSQFASPRILECVLAELGGEP